MAINPGSGVMGQLATLFDHARSLIGVTIVRWRPTQSSSIQAVFGRNATIDPVCSSFCIAASIAFASAA